MYINFKSKYKKIFWLLIGFLLACICVQKVNAQTVTIENSNISDINFTFNGVTYDYQKIKSDINTHLSSCGTTLDDYNYFILTMPSTPTTSTSGNNVYSTFFRINLFNTEVTGYDFKNQDYEGSSFITSSIPTSTIITWNMRTKTVSHNCSSVGTLYGFVHRGVSSSNYFKYYSNINWNNVTNVNVNATYPVYSKLLIDNSLFYSLPSYLNGYKKITLTTEDKYYMLSGLTEGSIFIPIEDFTNYGGRLSYYDNELSSQPYTSYIQDYVTTEDGLYVRQDFNLADYTGADWVMFSKYIYLEGEDDISYDIWVPDDIYDSEVTITPNTSGGNTFDFDYKDSNGNIQSGQVDSVDLSQDSPLFNQFFTNFSQNTFGLSSIITAPLSIIQSLDSTSCTPLNLPLPFVGGTLTLPCMYSFYQNTFGNLFTLYQTITFGIVSYWVCVRFLQFIKEFKDPDHDEIEVVNL